MIESKEEKREALIVKAVVVDRCRRDAAATLLSAVVLQLVAELLNPVEE